MVSLFIYRLGKVLMIMKGIPDVIDHSMKPVENNNL